jgi:hypothetical protein
MKEQPKTKKRFGNWRYELLLLLLLLLHRSASIVDAQVHARGCTG